MGDVGDHLRDQPGLGRDADPLGRTADRLLELVGRERRNRLGPAPEQLAEARGRERPVEEVRSQRHDHAEPALGSALATRRDSRNSFPLAVVAREREDLLELIDHERRPRSPRANASPTTSSRPRDPASSGRAAAGSDAPRSAGAPPPARRSGALPGRSRPRTRSAPSPSAPGRIAGTSPARTTDDFPPPLGPTTARNRDPGLARSAGRSVGRRAPRDRRSRRRRLR